MNQPHKYMHDTLKISIYRIYKGRGRAVHVHGWLGEFSPEQARTRMFIGVAVRHAPRGIFAAPNFPDAARDVATFPEHVAVENVRSLMNYGCARPASQPRIFRGCRRPF